MTNTIVESSMNNTERSISTPLNSNVSKKSMLAAIPVFSHTVMPELGTLGIPFFENSNVIDFLD